MAAAGGGSVSVEGAQPIAPMAGSKAITVYFDTESGPSGSGVTSSRQFTLTATTMNNQQKPLADITTRSTAGKKPVWKYNAYSGSAAFAITDNTGVVGKLSSWKGKAYTLVVNPPATDTTTYQQYCGGN